MSHLISNGRHLPYNHDLKNRAREMRSNQTQYEDKLWQYLRKTGIRFYRQKPLDNYIVDFYAPKLKLVIEVDGDSHYTPEAIEYDKIRTAVLNGYGIKVLRFDNADVKNNMDGVCIVIEEYIRGFQQSPPTPLL